MQLPASSTLTLYLMVYELRIFNPHFCVFVMKTEIMSTLSRALRVTIPLVGRSRITETFLFAYMQGTEHIYFPIAHFTIKRCKPGTNVFSIVIPSSDIKFQSKKDTGVNDGILFSGIYKLLKKMVRKHYLIPLIVDIK